MDIGRLNFGTITLLPKGEDADRIQRFRPMCLMDDSLKILTKGVNYRLCEVADEVIERSRIAFMKNRNIMEGILILHEVLHEVNRKKLSGVISKLILKKPTTM